MIMWEQKCSEWVHWYSAVQWRSAVVLMLLLAHFQYMLFTSACLRWNHCVQVCEKQLANTMTVLFVLFYSLNMVVAEVVLDSVSVGTFIFLKHLLPSLVTILGPLAILYLQQDIREEAKVPVHNKGDGHLRLSWDSDFEIQSLTSIFFLSQNVRNFGKWPVLGHILIFF